MRYLFTLSISVFSFLFSTANSDGGCGTTKPANYQHYTSEAERLGIVMPSASRAGVRYVPVTYHIVNKTNGTGGISLSKVFETHCELNKGYVQPQIYFYIHSIDTINDDALWAMSDGQGGTNYNLGYGAFSTNNVANVANVYITGALPGLCGFATFPNTAPNGGGLFLNKDCCGTGGTTIPHEMGHFFNLDHTFNQTNPPEYVTRTASWKNCATKGDGFCDTPADPSQGRAACPYTSTATDAHGEVYTPNVTLFMSYFNDNCVNSFSPQEQNEINAALSASGRSYLLNQTLPNLNPLDSGVFITPVAGDTTAIGSGISFKWHSIPGAQYYLFHLQPASSSLVLVDTVVVDTFFNTGGLQANKNYKFYVKGISFGNVCEGAYPYQYVQTSLIRATFNVVTANCPGDNNAVIAVTPSNGVAPYTFNWSNSQTTNTISSLVPGTYTVTITDNNGRVATAAVVVNDPIPVSVTINKVGSNLNAYGSGGTAPYTYSWNNGVNGQYNNNVADGSYTVTVTDSKGCTMDETFVISSTGISGIETRVAMKVFPNPASKVSSLNLQVDLNERTEANLLLMNVSGEIIQQFRKEFVAGTNITTINIEQLSSGVYFLQFRSAKTSKTERISVIK